MIKKNHPRPKLKAGINKFSPFEVTTEEPGSVECACGAVMQPGELQDHGEICDAGADVKEAES